MKLLRKINKNWLSLVFVMLMARWAQVDVGVKKIRIHQQQVSLHQREVGAKQLTAGNETDFTVTIPKLRKLSDYKFVATLTSSSVTGNDVPQVTFSKDGKTQIV